MWVGQRLRGGKVEPAPVHRFTQVRVLERPSVRLSALRSHSCIDEFVVGVHGRHQHQWQAALVVVVEAAVSSWRLNVDVFAIQRPKAMWKVPFQIKVLGYRPPFCRSWRRLVMEGKNRCIILLKLICILLMLHLLLLKQLFYLWCKSWRSTDVFKMEIRDSFFHFGCMNLKLGLMTLGVQM